MSQPSKSRTPQQIAASIRNSQKSTGPTTEAGKSVSSQNAVVHGLSSRFALQNWESEEEYRKLYDGFASDFPPHSGFEQELLETLVNARWLVRRAIFLQEWTFDLERPNCADTKLLELYMRYQNAHERAFQRAHAALLKQRAERQKHAGELRRRELDRQFGFVSRQRQAVVDTRKQELHALTLRQKNTAIQLQEARLATLESLAASRKPRASQISVADPSAAAPDALKTAA